MPTNQDIKKFQQTVWDFYHKNRRDFPWRETKDPYQILVSEIMLQQTQAPRVVAFYEKWIKRFPDVKTLARAKFSQIYPLWQGLGYNRRALALQKLAAEVMKKYDGVVPIDTSLLEELPGIGPYTARAVAIFSGNRQLTCIETNIRRVFIHYFFADVESVSDAEILPLLELALPPDRSREWHWALMDYGAYLKSAVKNPNRRAKGYAVQSKFEGSLRQIRGGILKHLAEGPKNLVQVVEYIQREEDKILAVLETMKNEGFIVCKGKKYFLG